MQSKPNAAMTNKPWLIAILLISACLGTAYGEDAIETGAYVGTFLKISEVTCFGDRRVAPGTKYESERTWIDADGEFEMILCHDRNFEVTFRVEEVLAGNLRKGSTIKIHTHDPNSIPSIAFQKTSLFSVFRRDDGNLWLNNWVAVYKKKEGGFAQCGCKVLMHYVDELDGSEFCQTMELVPSARLNLVDLSDYYLDSIQRDPTYFIENDHAVCRRGLEVAHVLSIWKKEEERND